MKKLITLIVAIAIVLSVSALHYSNPVAASTSSGYETWDDYGYGVRSQLDEIIADGQSLTGGSAGDYLSINQYTVSGKYETLTFKGWCGYDMPVAGIGYTINGGENVFNGEFTAAEAESHAATYGGDFAIYYSVDVPVSGITEKTRITLIALLEDDTAVALNRYEIYVQEKQEQIVKKDVAITEGGTGQPICFSDYGSVAFKIRIDENWRLGQFVVINSPTWDMTDAGLTACIYKWDNDIDTTLKGKELGTCIIEDHINCTSMVLTFGYIPAGDYLIEFTDFELKIGGYVSNGPTASQKDSFKFYLDGYESDSNIPQLKMVLYDNTVPPEITAAPETPIPTENPTAAPTDTATDVPSDNATDEPAVTDSPAVTADQSATDNNGQGGTATQAPESDSKSSGNNSALPIILGIIGALIVAAVIAAVILSKKKKK